MCARFLVFCVLTLLVCGVAIAQDQMEDVIHFKDGGVVRGTIIEQVPNKTVKIQTRDGNILVFDFSRIERITKEAAPVRRQKSQSYGTRFEFSALAGGAIYGGFYFGAGVRAGVTFGPGVYVGAVVVNHFTEEVNISYAGGEVGYTARIQQLTVQPYVSSGIVFGGGYSAFYVGPGLAVYVWPVPSFGIGPDLKYAYVPDLADGFGGIYLALAFRF